MAYQVANQASGKPATQSSADPAVTAAGLKTKNAAGDGGDHLQDVIAHGTARNSMVTLQSPETRDLSSKADNNRDPSPVHPARARQQTPAKVGDVVTGELPATLGASAAPAPVDPFK